ncbi:N-6 DNA methylase [Nocardioides sp. GXZ039]|uniref:N-6 DNA methylase n=1 Tax=Nocardioides sp. GXZ039 TaxID=3136018 RepID=UPI0030F3CAAD
MDDLRRSVLDAERSLGSRTAAWDAVLATVARAQGLADAAPPDDGLAPWRDPDAIDRLGPVYESLLDDRHGSGSFYTPPALVEWLLDRALSTDAEGPLLDPACGTGNVLVAALRRLGPEASDRLHGTDLDPIAVAITRLRLRREAPSVEPRVLAERIRVADGLGEHPAAPFAVVIGNPPFLGQLRGRTADPTRPGLGAYTDTSAAFLHRSLSLVETGGVVALVQPISVLAARDAGPVRDAVSEVGAVTDFWTSTTPVFPGTTVITCAPVATVGAAPRPVATWSGPDAVRGPDVVLDPGVGEWGALAAPALGLPVVRPRAAGVLGDLAECTADFRDQYYGLVPFVTDGIDATPLVTSGLIDPARCHWGRSATRFAKRSFSAPSVDLGRLEREGTLAAWARARLVPKVLVATQGRVIEAVVDADGAWLPSVPVVSVVPPADRLWHVLAVLLSPPVVALAAARYAGTALATSAIKLSARQVAALPLPVDHTAWDDGARLARAAQDASDEDLGDALRAVAERMCVAYDDDSALLWWVERAETRVRSRS